jgi:hypothetical protein
MEDLYSFLRIMKGRLENCKKNADKINAESVIENIRKDLDYALGLIEKEDDSNV